MGHLDQDGPTSAVADNTVMVNSTVCSPACNDAAWATPFALSVPAPADDDISSIIAFGGNKVGLFWSNQSTNADYFAVHNDAMRSTRLDGGDRNVGTRSRRRSHQPRRPTRAGGFSRPRRPVSAARRPLARLLVRTPAGNWVVHVFGLSNENHTRPIVLLDQTAGLIRMYASPETGGKIYEKTLPLADADNPVDFAPGLGTVFIDDGGTKLNNSTSTKQNLDALDRPPRACIQQIDRPVLAALHTTRSRHDTAGHPDCRRERRDVDADVQRGPQPGVSPGQRAPSR